MVCFASRCWWWFWWAFMNLFFNRPYETYLRHLVYLFGRRLCWLAWYQTSAKPVNRSDTYRIFALVVLYESGICSKMLSTFWTKSYSLEEVLSNLGGCGRFRGSFLTSRAGVTCMTWVTGQSCGGGGGGGGGSAIFWTKSHSLEEVPSNLGGCGRFRDSFWNSRAGVTCMTWVTGQSCGGGGGGGGGGLPLPWRSGGGVRSLWISSSISAEIPRFRLVELSRSLIFRRRVAKVRSRPSIDYLLFSQLLERSSCFCFTACWLHSFRLRKSALIWSNSACATPMTFAFSSSNFFAWPLRGPI